MQHVYVVLDRKSMWGPTSRFNPTAMGLLCGTCHRKGSAEREAAAKKEEKLLHQRNIHPLLSAVRSAGPLSEDAVVHGKLPKRG
ncbi:hypothetical protein CDAR_248511 [Caerostris darwini]|uniref:Uncharacterized protein n=1 Tax=Caerostris darwini TaxID=1538125 RepID=A0AAV4Q1L0_9ARAC|nr:hypothetical protein CDAR_248511 [Caerostris darwini]